MKLLKILAPVAICLVLALAILPGNAEAAAVASGTCGDNLTWTLDDAGTLTISGTGPMTDYDWNVWPGWYEYNETFSRVVIGEGVTTIGEMAFWTCYMDTVELPSTLTMIGEKAFFNSGLKNITIPAGVTKIGAGAFSDCSALTRIWVAEENTSYSSDNYGVLFNKEKTVLIQVPCLIYGDGYVYEEYRVPGTVTYIAEEAFSECWVANVYIPASVNLIGEDVFYRCHVLQKITVSQENTAYSSDDKGALFNKDKTTLFRVPSNLFGSYTVPQTVTTIAPHTFEHCGSLEEVFISAGVTEIGAQAFQGCELKSIVVHANNTKFSSDGKVLFNKDKTELIVCTCKIDSEYTIPDTVTVIEALAFEYRGLKVIHIPAGMTKIGDHAFYGCWPTDVYYDGTQEDWNKIEVSRYEFDGATFHFANKTIPGDIDGNEETTTDDAVYLLLSVMFGTEDYPVAAGVSLDFNDDGKVNTEDAVYLLLHVMFGEEDYPIS